MWKSIFSRVVAFSSALLVYPDSEARKETNGFFMGPPLQIMARGLDYWIELFVFGEGELQHQKSSFLSASGMPPMLVSKNKMF